MADSIIHTDTIDDNHRVLTVYKSGEIRYAGPGVDLEKLFVAVPSRYGALWAFDNLRQHYPFDGLDQFINEAIAIAREEFGTEWGSSHER